MSALQPTEIHVWPMRLAARPADVARFSHWLSVDERERAARFRFDAHRLAYVVARAGLRTLLGNYLGQRPETIAFAYGTNGKPRLAQDDALHFNVSHSGELAAFAFADCELGVDIEAERPLGDADGIASRFFSSEEHRDLMSLAPVCRNAAFFRCWTRKEAFVKASGLGLARPLDDFRVTVRPGERARVMHVGHDENEASRWTLHDLELDGYGGAVAYRAAARDLRVHAMLSAADVLAGIRAGRGTGRESANCEPTT